MWYYSIVNIGATMCKLHFIAVSGKERASFDIFIRVYNQLVEPSGPKLRGQALKGS